jgi:hypothetical protein|tara:strand:- start:202 stop:591 length:390 start_codon:yes stop_codon:yes gene_type:complete
MKVTIQTLVDITETGVRKGPDKLAVGQQTNWDTLIQVLGLRANPEPQQGSMENVDVSTYEFGKTYTGKHNVWTYEFWLPDGSVSIDNLENDFDLVPYIADLEESFASTIHVFLTKNAESCNILFQHSDK